MDGKQSMEENGTGGSSSGNDGSSRASSSGGVILSSCSYAILLDLAIPFVQNPRDRAAISLVSSSCKEIDGLTRKHITIGLCYTTTPERLVQRFPNLESLKLKGRPPCRMPEDWGGYVTPWIEEIVRSLPGMKKLHFTWMIVRDSDLKMLAESPVGEILEMLKLDECFGFSTDGLLYIGQLCRNMKNLFLERSRIHEKDGEWLKEIGSNSTVLEKLNFYKTALVEIRAEDLVRIASRCPSLTSVKTDSCNVDDFLKAAPSLESFTGDFSYEWINPEEDPENVDPPYAALVYPPRLCSLGMNCLKKEALPHVYPVASRLKKLDLLFALLDTEGHCLLLARCPNLEVLLTGYVIGDRVLEVLAQSCKKIRRLRIERTTDEYDAEGAVSHRGLIALAPGCLELEYLDVIVSDITNESLECLGTYSKNLCSFHLTLHPREERINDLTLDNGVKSLFIGCHKLRRFSLYLPPGGSLTDVGLGYIGRYGENVRSMGLGFVGVSDEGLLELSKGCPSLQKLEIICCWFSERALAKAALNLPFLRYLWVCDYPASDSGQDLLEMVRPNWNVELIPAREDNVENQGLVEQDAQILAYYSLAGQRRDFPPSLVSMVPTFGSPEGHSLHTPSPKFNLT